MSYLQYDNAGWVHRACSILSDRGLITFGTGLPTKLTKLGREFYGVSEKPMQKTEDKPQAQQPQSQHRQVAVVPKTRSNIVKFRRQMVEKVGQYLATHYRRNNKGRYIAESIGHSRNAVYGAIHTMTEKGWVHPEKPFSKKGFSLTPKGREHFGAKSGRRPPVKPVADAPRSEPSFTQLYDAPTPMPLPPKVEAIEQSVRSEPKPVFPPPAKPSIADIDTADLVLELIERGYIVKRG
jgi:DNA-binding PadR family transcriptional regulator